jgi:hypothetical protein
VHGGYGSTFTEILTEDGTVAELGNANSGDYLRDAWGDRSADFVQTGTNASGSYHVAGVRGRSDRDRQSRDRPPLVCRCSACWNPLPQEVDTFRHRCGSCRAFRRNRR